MWILRTVDPDRPRTRAFRIPSGRQKTFGRSGVADFVIHAPMISRVHCRLTASRDEALDVEDLTSTNGTFVNDERVERATLAVGDRLRIGRLELIVSRDRPRARA
jgi:pSer/pThr/pTyr-binding forkhead associated (FHA) protein